MQNTSVCVQGIISITEYAKNFLDINIKKY